MIDLLERLADLKAAVRASRQPTGNKVVLFLSFGEATQRAHVVKGVAMEFDQAYAKLHERFLKKTNALKIDPVWLKLDWVTDEQLISMKDLKSLLNQSKLNYFREGIAFDSEYKIAFLEQELHANAMIAKPSASSPIQLFFKNINFYLKSQTGLNLQLHESFFKQVILFKTKGFLHDGLEVVELSDKPLSNGVRQDALSKDLTLSLIDQGVSYLQKNVDDQGRFHYGIFPQFNRDIPTYNALRHASTLYAMIEAYEVLKKPGLDKVIERAIQHLISDHLYMTESPEGEALAFVIEREADHEIKLGASATAILALTKYEQVISLCDFSDYLHALARGLKTFQTQEGGFVHVLNYPDLSVKEAFRVVYYDGEACYALLCMYKYDHNEAWLSMAKRAFHYFLQHDYYRYKDHWLSYASNELFQVTHDEAILKFNLENAKGILSFAMQRETTYPTLLELLMATDRLIRYCNSKKTGQETLSTFEHEILQEAIETRAKHQLNGFFFPEVAMYFKNPETILGSFFIRHHAFRVRIDDIEHNLSGYIAYHQKKWP